MVAPRGLKKLRYGIEDVLFMRFSNQAEIEKNLNQLQKDCLPRVLLSGIQLFRYSQTGFRLKTCRNDRILDFC
jgi:hypothetical protein